MIDPERLSQYEFCPRYELLMRTKEPPRVAVRYGVRQFFEQGIEALQKKQKNVPDQIANAFLDYAATRGFAYPSDNWQPDYGNHVTTDVYTLANDYCSWLDGALRLVEEQIVPGKHLWHVVDRFEPRLRWSDLLALVEGPVTAHYFRLPALRNGRLPSPLSLAYRHPMTGCYHLHSTKPFNNNFKRLGRWELKDEVDWDEWRDLLIRDEALNAICREVDLDPSEHPMDGVREDAEVLMQAIEENTDPPRHRESCQRGCSFLDYCHGSGEGFVSITSPSFTRMHPESSSGKVTGISPQQRS